MHEGWWLFFRCHFYFSLIVSHMSWLFLIFFIYFPNSQLKKWILFVKKRCRRGIKHFVVNFSRIKSLHVPSKDAKDAFFERINWWKGVCFPPELAFQLWSFINGTTFPICTFTWSVNKYVSRLRKSINRRNESTKILNFRSDDVYQSPFCFLTSIILTSF